MADKIAVTKMNVTNMGKGMRGVNVANADGGFAGTKLIGPGKTLEGALMTDAEMRTASQLVFQPTEEASQSRRQSRQPDEFVDDVDDEFTDMTDEELHEHLKDRDGRARPANTKRETLLEQARNPD